MNIKIKKITIITLLFGIIASPFQLNALTKEETVYVKLNNTGKKENIFVNTHIINNEKLEILTDETDLLNIMNINGNESFTQNNTTLTWNAKGKDIYYQGTTEKELPISIDIKYYLNNEEKTLNEILGKNGNIKLKLKYTNHDEHETYINGKKEILYTPFTALTGMIIKGENNQDIKVNNGKVINNGKDNIIIGLTSPGLYESLNIKELQNMDEITIEFTTNKFELPNIYTAVTPKIINEEDLKIFEKADNLYNKLNTLKTSIDEIETGAQNLVNGSSQLFEGTSLIHTNLEMVITKLEELEKGTTKIDEGLKLILENLKNTKNLLITLNINDISNLINANDNLINNTTDANVKALLTQNNTVLTGIKDLSININGVINLLETALQELEVGSKQISDGTTKLKDGIKILTTKTQELNIGTETLYNGTKSLANGITKFNQEGITKIYNSVNTNIKGTENRIKAIIKLGENYDTFSLNNKDNTSSTKFIINIPGAKYKETKTTIKETKKEETIWNRIKNLFK